MLSGGLWWGVNSTNWIYTFSFTQQQVGIHKMEYSGFTFQIHHLSLNTGSSWDVCSCMQYFALLDCIPIVCRVNVPADVLMVRSHRVGNSVFLNAAAIHWRFFCWSVLIQFLTVQAVCSKIKGWKCLIYQPQALHCIIAGAKVKQK